MAANTFSCCSAKIRLNFRMAFQPLISPMAMTFQPLVSLWHGCACGVPPNATIQIRLEFVVSKIFSEAASDNKVSKNILELITSTVRKDGNVGRGLQKAKKLEDNDLSETIFEGKYYVRGLQKAKKLEDNDLNETIFEGKYYVREMPIGEWI
nr:hypothetical protein [Tanacetum cinerariifolium]